MLPIPVAVGVVVGGAAIVGSKTSRKGKKRRLIDTLSGKPLEQKSLGQRMASKATLYSPELGKWIETTTEAIERLDERYHNIIKQKLDPLLAGRMHEEHFKALSAGREAVMSPEEKSVNRNILLGIGGTSLAVTNAVFALPLAPVLLGLGIYLSWPVYKMAYELAVREKRLSTAHLMALYFSGMWLGGFYVIGMLGTIIAAVSQKFMHICEDVSRYELVNVFQQQPRSVWMLVDGAEIEVPFERVKSGDTLIIDVGQTIPVDGEIVSGEASIDQHMLTGESQPVEMSIGDHVLASTIMLGGRISVRVEKAGSETNAAQIGEILNRGTEYQLSMEARAVKIADRTLFPMLAISGASLPLVGVTGATAVLGSNFTLNMIWLRLLTMLNFLNVASKHKVLVKNGEALEQLKQIDTVVFDKTGTLTIEQPSVVHIHACSHYDSEGVLTMAAAAEHRQKHPVAQAILEAAENRQLTVPSVDEAKYDIGFGIKVKLNGRWIRVGSRRFMDMENITIPDDMQLLETDSHEHGHSLVYVADDDALAGMIELKATTRPEAEEIVRGLHERGLKLFIISGDSEVPTRALADELEVDGYFAGVLPEGKADLIEQLQAEGRKVCFIGDGINDAIALKQSDVSVSLSGATTAATDTADVVLMDADLKQLITLMNLSHALDDNIDLNFKWAGGLSLVSVGGVLFFHAGFLLVEILAAVQILQGVAIASKPLLGNDKPSRKRGKLPTLFEKSPRKPPFISKLMLTDEVKV